MEQNVPPECSRAHNKNLRRAMTITTTPEAPIPVFPSPLQEFWHGFSANRGALAALVVFVLIALASLFAGVIAPYNPIEQFRDHMLTPPVWAAGGSTQFPARHR